MESTSIYAALAAVQSELKAPKGQMNTFGGYRYRSCEDILEAVKPILKAHNLLLTLSDEPKVLEGWHYIEATAKLESLDGGCISHLHESETAPVLFFVAGFLPLPGMTQRASFP